MTDEIDYIENAMGVDALFFDSFAKIIDKFLFDDSFAFIEFGVDFSPSSDVPLSFYDVAKIDQGLESETHSLWITLVVLEELEETAH